MATAQQPPVWLLQHHRKRILVQLGALIALSLWLAWEYPSAKSKACLSQQEMVHAEAKPRMRHETLWSSHSTVRLRIPNQPDWELVDGLLDTVAPVNTSMSDYNPFETCMPTSQVELVLPSRSRFAESGASSRTWIMQSLDHTGSPKTVGGDEFYVTFDDGAPSPAGLNETNSTVPPRAPIAVAIITDRLDGTYELDFVSPPMRPYNTTERVDAGPGILTVYFVYTCGIGQAYQPIKDTWSSGGGSHRTHSIELRHPLTQSALPPPPIRSFVRPTQYTNTLNAFATRIAVGDSLMGQFVEAYRHEKNHPLVNYHENIWKILTVSTLSYWLDRIDEWHGEHLRTNASSVALVIGSSSWDVLHYTNVQPHPGSQFVDHLTAVRTLITSLQERYPAVSIFWKSPTALHLQMVKPQCWSSGNQGCANITRYLSQSRASYLHAQQTRIMQELNVPLLDVFEATYLSAHEHKPGDGIHYNRAFSTHLLSWFFAPHSRVASKSSSQ